MNIGQNLAPFERAPLAEPYKVTTKLMAPRDAHYGIAVILL